MLGDRSAFPHVDASAYFNHASIAPTPSFAIDAAKQALDDYAQHGAGAWPLYRDQRERLREKLARLVGAAIPATEIGLVPSTSQGVVDVALSIPWKRGDRVVLFRGEFPTNVTPWQRAAETFDLELVWLDANDFLQSHARGLASLDAVLENQPVRLIAVSAVQFQTGLRMPLAALASRAHACGAELFVDAIQAVGATPIDVAMMDIDYLVAGSHKWLMSPEGCGFVYVRQACAQQLQARVAGWLSHEDGAAFLFEGAGHLRYDRPIRQSADMFEIGAQNTVGFAALEASVDKLLSLGVPNIHSHVQRLLDRAEDCLREHGFTSQRSPEEAGRSTILSATPPSDAASLTALHEHLGNGGVACSIPDGLLRLSPHWPNDLDQVEVLAEALSSFDGLR